MAYFVRAKADFVGTTKAHMSLKKGQHLIVQASDPSGWWKGRLDTIEG